VGWLEIVDEFGRCCLEGIETCGHSQAQAEGAKDAMLPWKITEYPREDLVPEVSGVHGLAYLINKLSCYNFPALPSLSILFQPNYAKPS
jgi:hypothetical protein